MTIDGACKKTVAHHPMIGKTFTLTTLAQYIGMPKRTLYRQLEDGRFPVQPIPRTNPRRWDVDAVDAWRRGEM